MAKEICTIVDSPNILMLATFLNSFLFSFLFFKVELGLGIEFLSRKSNFLTYVSFIYCCCRVNLSPANEILTRGIKSERRLFTKKTKMNRFIKMPYQSRVG